MEQSTAERCTAEFTALERPLIDRLPWPVAVTTIGGLAGTGWLLAWLVVMRLVT